MERAPVSLRHHRRGLGLRTLDDGLSSGFSPGQWATMRETLSGHQHAVGRRPGAGRRAHPAHRSTNWQLTAVSLAQSGADIRPLLAHAPGIRPVAAAGRSLATHAATSAAASPPKQPATTSKPACLLGHAGLSEEPAKRAGRGLQLVSSPGGGPRARTATHSPSAAHAWRRQAVTVSAPPRIDLGGGWSDTPPFCLDWGGTVLNIAITFDDEYPIRTTVRRLDRAAGAVRLDGRVARWSPTAPARRSSHPSSPAAPSPSRALRCSLPKSSSRENRWAPHWHAAEAASRSRPASTCPWAPGWALPVSWARTVLRALAEMLGVALNEPLP